MKIKILIVDDYNIFRRGLKLILDNEESFVVIGEALNPDGLFNLLNEVQPDVIVLDLMLPHKSVISIAKKLYRKFPEIPYLLITTNPVEYTILECVIHGAKGIIWKENTPEELIKAIKVVASGERFFEIPESQMISEVVQHAHNSPLKENHLDKISARENEVLKLFARGMSYKQIGEVLNISPRTVESHKKNILSKLKLNSTAELVKYAIKNKLINL